MTLILSCITDDYVFQVSDRLLTDSVKKLPIGPEANKAVDFWGKVNFGYTGLANLRGKSVDGWIAETVINCISVYEAVETLRESATTDFKGINSTFGIELGRQKYGLII